VFVAWLVHVNKCLHSAFFSAGILEGQTGIAVGGEDLLDRVDVGGSSQVQAQVETGSGLHDGASLKIEFEESTKVCLQIVVVAYQIAPWCSQDLSERCPSLKHRKFSSGKQPMV
jgi:hypothetical protein